MKYPASRYPCYSLFDQDRKYGFIIDEIHRGNLSKIFGELVMLIQPDKRSREWEV